MAEWWKEAVFYHIFPMSFADSNEDGIRDLKGLESKLDYLVTLGIDAIWLSPVFVSPMRDAGYDVADHTKINPIFGSQQDFISVLNAIKKKNIRLVLDLVVNHSSDESEWFKSARSSRQSPFHDWYIWVEDTGKPPNNWKAILEVKSAWHSTHCKTT